MRLPQIDEKDRGKCATCGFLAAKFIPPAPSAAPGVADAVVVEVCRESRADGALLRINHPDKVGSTGTSEPMCVRRVANLESEYADGCRRRAQLQGHVIDYSEQRDAARETIWHDRRCDAWHAYTPGMSPTEHIWELGMITAAKDLKAYLDGLERARDDSQRKTFRVEIGIAAAGIALTLAAGWFSYRQVSLATEQNALARQQVELAIEALKAAPSPVPVRVEVSYPPPPAWWNAPPSTKPDDQPHNP